IQANDEERAAQEAKLGEENARLNLAVLLFPNFFQDFTLVDDLAAAPALPPLALDGFYGIDANHFATRTDGIQNLGYSATATLDIPVWHWGSIQSKVKQAELQRRQAQVELTAAQRQAIADLRSFYAEAETARGQLDMLRRTADLAAESL